ncbi:Copper chaperone CopZ [Hymenobacter psychrotolerans DSM 18569]|uniref:Copper chaperone CopZ n=2 Tax=Hymenobacteraceae TaxID=1853232 RepID=A0A1M7A1J8_9BACT|nr:Copper chaperone CopZ [Hymenobacter psychrotolerans DSM 18569]
MLYFQRPGLGPQTQIVMKTLHFKTNINCGGCIKAVTPTLNEQAGAGNWQVDTANPDKILTVSSERLTTEQVVKAVEQAGFSIQAV